VETMNHEMGDKHISPNLKSSKNHFYSNNRNLNDILNGTNFVHNQKAFIDRLCDLAPTSAPSIATCYNSSVNNLYPKSSYSPPSQFLGNCH